MALPVVARPLPAGQVAAPLSVHNAVAAQLVRLAPVSVPGTWTPDPLGPVSPAARQIKGQLELSANGGSELGAVGIAPSAGPGSWSDDRMPFTRGHFIPYAIGGIQSANLGDLGPGGVGGIPEPKRAWFGAQATHPMASLNKPDFADQLAGMRYPVSLGVSQRAPALTQALGGPYAIGTADVLPPLQADPYGSLPPELMVALGGPVGRTW